MLEAAAPPLARYHSSNLCFIFDPYLPVLSPPVYQHKCNFVADKTALCGRPVSSSSKLTEIEMGFPAFRRSCGGPAHHNSHLSSRNHLPHTEITNSRSDVLVCSSGGSCQKTLEEVSSCSQSQQCAQAARCTSH